jgi:cyclase
MMMKLLFRKIALAAFILALGCCPGAAQPSTQQIGKDLYAHISDNDASANSTFLVGEKEILVVDTGLNASEGAKLVSSIRRISNLPVEYVVNTHYHPDHQGGNIVVGPNAMVISTDVTRERTLALMQAPDGPLRFKPADLSFSKRITVYVGAYPVEIFFPGKAHTSGDALVYFPEQKAIAMGDLFLNRSCPAMDDGSVENWIHALDQVLALPIEKAVPGHFELGTRSDLLRFRDYLNDIYEQVAALKSKGETLEQVVRDIHLEKYSDFRQFPKYEATFSDNASTIYRELAAKP